jgi:hypothetical protein
MKYLLIFLLSFAFISPALAANTVRGIVPKLLPLQPAPAGISPAYNKNIQYQDSNYAPSAGSSNASTGFKENQQLGKSPVPGQSLAVIPVQSNGARHYVWWLVILLIAIILGYLVYKRVSPIKIK